MSKPSTPPAPDYTAVAQEQGQQNQALNAEQTYANRPDVTTPWGSLTYGTGTTIDPATGQPVTTWSENVGLTPAEQQSLNQQQSIQTGRSNLAANLMNTVGTDLNEQPGTAQSMQSLTGAGQGINYNPTGFDTSAENAVWNQFQNMQLPLQQQQTEQTQSQLEAQGLRPGDAAYDTQMKNLMNTQFQQQQTAEDNAVLAGQQQGNTEFQLSNAAQAQGYGQGTTQTLGNNAMIAGNLQNQLTELGLNQEQAGYGLNLMNAALNGQQVGMPSFPGASQAQQAQPANLLQAAEDQGNSMLNAYNAQVGSSNSTTSDIISALGTAASIYFSDERMKTDKERIGETDDGTGIYKFRYKGDPSVRMGVMAQELRKKKPHAVHKDPNSGMLAVDYSKVA